MQNGGANFTEYSNVNQFLVSLNGILQSPTDSFTVSGSTITFASNLITGDVIDFIIVLGNSLDVGVPSDNTVSLAKLTATGTKDATTFLRGDNTFAEAGGGIEEADQWRLTADFTGGADPISSNLEQVDTGSQGTIGSAMTVSSGIFTFPSTGIWLVMFNLDAFTTTTDGLITLLIQATTDNSTYNNIARGNAGIDYPNGNTIEASATTYSLVDVTDTTQVKVKFKADSINPTTTVKGDTALNETFFTFIRLGDT
jgi:hypothetical protein